MLPLVSFLYFSICPSSVICLSPAWRHTPSQSFSTQQVSYSYLVEPTTTQCLWASSSVRGTLMAFYSSVISMMALQKSPLKMAKLQFTSTLRQKPKITGWTYYQVGYLSVYFCLYAAVPLCNTKVLIIFTHQYNHRI